jgi:stage II sporulation protein R
MRSKTVVWAYLIVLSLGTILSLYIPKNEVVAKEAIVIPGDAIRLRILANSDLESDQALKRQVRDAVNAQITLWVKDLTSLEKAKTVIHEKLPEIQAIAERVVADQGSDQSVKVKFGKVQFPTKLYGQFLYPAGEYQAILITLGEGKGANWWCVLYPPLCFLDFSNGVAVSDGFEGKKTAKAAAAPKVETADDSKVEIADDSKVETAYDSKVENADDSKVETAVDSKVETNSEVDVASKVDTVSRVENEPKVEQAPKHVVEDTVTEETDSAAIGNQEEKKLKKVHHKKAAPVYTAEDEQQVKVKFFVVELWQKMFD